MKDSGRILDYIGLSVKNKKSSSIAAASAQPLPMCACNQVFRKCSHATCIPHWFSNW